MFVASLGCAQGTEPEPTPEPGVSEPEAPADAPFGTITTRILDNATGEVVCEQTRASSALDYDPRFSFSYNYIGDPTGEIAAILLNAPGATATFVLEKDSDLIHDLPPSASHVWTHDGVRDYEGSVGCGAVDADGNIVDGRLVVFTFENETTNLSSMAATVDTATPLDGFAAGWADATLLCPTEVVSTETCQVYGATGTFTFSAAGSGVEAQDGLVYRFEVDVTATQLPLTLSRATE